PPVGHHVEHGFEIALLGPADKADRIVLPPLLIVRIIATGAIGAGDLEGEFLLVEISTGKLEPCHADQHDATPLAAHQGCLMDRLAALGGSSDDDGIDPAATRKAL